MDHHNDAHEAHPDETVESLNEPDQSSSGVSDDKVDEATEAAEHAADEQPLAAQESSDTLDK
jgi:hypothetical protein